MAEGAACKRGEGALMVGRKIAARECYKVRNRAVSVEQPDRQRKLTGAVKKRWGYNYFPVKAAMFFDEAGDILAELAAVRYRAAGQSVLEAVGHFIAGRAEWSAGRGPEQPTARCRGLIADSAALQTHRRLMFAGYESALADPIAEETGARCGAVEPFVAAAALNLLAGGLATYAVRPGSPSGT